MADLTPIPSVQRPSDSEYQPVSGYAVAAAIFAGIFVVFMLFVAVQTVRSSRSALEPWLLALPFAGLVCAVIARAHIRNAEGTRTGLRLASTAWWICVLGGVGYGAYLYANSLALEYESGKFADQMFQDLKDGRVQSAFGNYLVPPEERNRVPVDGPADAFESAYVSSGYNMFRNHEVVRLFTRNGKDVTFERIKVKESGQESKGLYAIHVYRLTCPEGTFECQVTTMASEARKGGKLQWRIPNQPTPGITGLKVLELSRYGMATMELSQDGESAAHRWTDHLANARTAWAQMLTTSGAKRHADGDGLLHLALLGGGPTMIFPAGPQFLPPDRAANWENKKREIGKGNGQSSALSEQDLPFEELAAIGFFRRDNAGAPLPEDKLNHFRDLWRLPRLDAYDPRAPSLDSTPALAPIISVTPERIRVIVSANLFEKASAMHYRCAIAVDCTDADVLTAVNAARQQGIAASNDDSLTRKTMPPRFWQIAWLRIDPEPLVPVGPGGAGR